MSREKGKSLNISNIFSGIAINLEKPFKVGDWVKIGAYDEGKIIDITWRTTRIMQRDNNIIHLPNGIAAESAVVNFNKPNPTYELWISFHAESRADPKRVIKIALDAFNSLHFISKEVRPSCRFIGFTEWSGEYVGVLVLDDYARRNVLRGAAVLHLWNTLYKAGIHQAIRTEEIYLQKISYREGHDLPKSTDILRSIDILRQLPEDMIKHIASSMRIAYYPSGSTIVAQGEAGDSLFIIVEGVVGISIKLPEGESLEVDRMAAGDFFGEMALLTGEPRTASVTTITDTQVFEITKENIAPFISESPQIAELLGQALTQRMLNQQAKKDSHAALYTEEQTLYVRVLTNIRKFFFGNI